jgi:hypothetical protein
MFRQFLVGSSVSLGNIVIPALVMTTVVRVMHIAAERHRLLPTSHMIVVMVVTGIGLDGGASLPGARLVARLRDHRCRACGSRSPLFRVCELHDARIRRRNSRGAAAADRTDNGNERCARVRLVDRRHFRGAAKDDQAHVAGRGRSIAYHRCNKRERAARELLRAQRLIHTVIPGSKAVAPRCGSSRRRSVLRSWSPTARSACQVANGPNGSNSVTSAGVA